MTNYRLSKLVNFRLEEEGLDPIRPQQIYNVRKGLKELEGPEALEFINKYVETRKTGRTTRSIDPQEWFELNK